MTTTMFNNKKPLIIGFHSPYPQCGKGESAKYLRDMFGFARISFADPLRHMLTSLLIDLGIDIDRISYYLNDRKGKQEVIPELGVTGRHMMITLGTDWARNMINNDIWAKVFEARLQYQILVCCDDVRFVNEIEQLKQRNAVLIKIKRDLELINRSLGEPLVIADHPSNKEFPDSDFDYTIENNGTLKDLHDALYNFVAPVVRSYSHA